MKDQADVYLIGIQEGDHPGGARFTAFCSHLNARFVSSPLGFRYMWGSRIGERVDRVVGKLSRRPWYSFGLLVMELATGVHMLRHRGAVYYSVKGEVDLHFLPLLSRLTGTHLLATFHDGRDKLNYWKIDRHLTRNLAGVVLLSGSQRPHFEPLLPPERIFHVPHGVDTDRFRPAAALSEQPVAIAVGAYSRDYRTLEAALPLVWQKNPSVRFVLVGTRQAEKDNPAPRIDDRRVQYVDGISDDELRDTYQMAAVAVVPVLEATANNAVLEGMACGLPIVATDVGGIAEYVGDEAGVLCRPADPQALADGILQVLGDRDAAIGMGAAGRRRAISQFDYRVVASQLRDVFARVKQPAARAGRSAAR